ncbi:MAG: FlgO family outer membrane protein [Candidatus Brocadiia bacterium]
MMRTNFLAIPLAAHLALVAVAARGGELPRVAVVDFAERGELKGTDSGRLVAELVASRLEQHQGGRFEVYERMELKRIVDELKLSSAEIFDSRDKAARLGKLAKVHFLVVGSIGKLGENHVVVARVVGVATGRVRAAADVVERDLESIPARLDELIRDVVPAPPAPPWMRRLGLVPLGPQRDPDLGLFRRVEHEPTGIRLVLVPAGEFTMGSSLGAREAAARYGRPAHLYERERPARTVRLTRPFYMGQCEVTNAQFRRTFPTHHSGSAHGLSLDGDRQPAVNVSFEQAVAFCERHGMRLPTEGEWEYACRAGGEGLFWWGDAPEDGAGRCNVHDRTSRDRGVAPWTPFPFRDGHAVAAPVGTFAPNPFGLHDMHGNVWEWCQDRFDPGFYARRPSPDADPLCRTASERLGPVLRGGSWREGPERVRAACRDWSVETVGGPDRGFRVVMDVPPAGP